MKYPYGVQYPDQLPALEYGLTGITGITAVQAAIANRDNAACNFVVIGDSVTEGEGATTFESRCIAQANRAARQAYPTVANGSKGGLGFIPIASTGSATYTWPITATGTPGGFDVGPVRASTETFGATTWTFTAPAGTTSVKIMYFDAAFPGEFSYRVNSGAVTNVNSTETSTDLLTSSITMTGGDVLTIAFVSGGVLLDGIIHYAGDETSGITFHGCGHFGWNTSADAPNGWLQPETFELDWAQCYGAFAPAAIMIVLGINDAGSYTAAEFQANLLAFIALLQAQPALAAVPVIPVIEYEPAITFVSGSWAPYAAADRAAAAVTPNSHVIDLNYRMPSVASGFDDFDLYSDDFHPSDLGHALVGEIVAAGLRVA